MKAQTMVIEWTLTAAEVVVLADAAEMLSDLSEAPPRTLPAIMRALRIARGQRHETFRLEVSGVLARELGGVVLMNAEQMADDPEFAASFPQDELDAYVGLVEYFRNLK